MFCKNTGCKDQGLETACEIVSVILLYSGEVWGGKKFISHNRLSKRILHILKSAANRVDELRMESVVEEGRHQVLTN
jgi:hypothetical protein